MVHVIMTAFIIIQNRTIVCNFHDKLIKLTCYNGSNE